jgi:hypothetical protein
MFYKKYNMCAMNNIVFMLDIVSMYNIASIVSTYNIVF